MAVSAALLVAFNYAGTQSTHQSSDNENSQNASIEVSFHVGHPY